MHRALRRPALSSCLAACGAATLLVVAAVQATTHHAIVADGALSDWELNEQFYDPGDDSRWTAANELTLLGLTWDNTALYLRLDYRVSTNALLVYLDLGRASAGEDDFHSGRGYGGAFPRDVQLAGWHADLLVAAWDNQAPYVYTLAADASTDISPLATIGHVFAAGQGAWEVAIPWTALYGSLPATVPAGATARLAAVLCGGDNSTCGDQLDGTLDLPAASGTTVLSSTLLVHLDRDGDGRPDRGVAPYRDAAVDLAAVADFSFLSPAGRTANDDGGPGTRSVAVSWLADGQVSTLISLYAAPIADYRLAWDGASDPHGAWLHDASGDELGSYAWDTSGLPLGWYRLLAYIDTGLGPNAWVASDPVLVGMRKVTINEVAYDQAGTDGNGPNEFVELFGAPNQDLSGCRVRHINGADGLVISGHDHNLNGYSLRADGFFVIGGAVSIVLDGTSYTPDMTSTTTWQNGPDNVVLSCGAVTIDALGYGSFSGTQVYRGEGLAAPLSGDGRALARDVDGRDSDDNRRDFSIKARPTPGLPNNRPPLVSVDLPASDVVAHVFLGYAYTASDADGDSLAIASFLQVDGGTDRIALEAGLAVGGPHSRLLNVLAVPEGDYRVLVVASDGRNAPVQALAPGRVTIDHTNQGFPIYLQQPAGLDRAANRRFTVRWLDYFWDQGSGARAEVYLSRDDCLLDTSRDERLASGLLADGMSQSWDWDCSAAAEGLACLCVRRVLDSSTDHDCQGYVHLSHTVVNELYYDPPGADVNEFIELAGTPGAPLDGCALLGYNGAASAGLTPYNTVVLDGRSLDAGGYFLVGGTSLWIVIDGTSYQTLPAPSAWQNGPDSVVLSCFGDVVDAVGYGVFAPTEYYFGEGDPAPDCASTALIRNPDRQDTDDNAADLVCSTAVTPGAPNLFPNTCPTITLLRPVAGAQANLSYELTWQDSDPDDDARIALWWDDNDDPGDNTDAASRLIVADLSESSSTNRYTWDVSGLPEGLYYIYATISDGHVRPSPCPQALSYGPAPLTVDHDPPPAFAWIEPNGVDDVAVSGYFILRWTSSDPGDDSAVLDLYFSDDEGATSGTLLTPPGGIGINATLKQWQWDTSALAPGQYWLWADVYDAGNPAAEYRPAGPVTVPPPNDPPSFVFVAPADGRTDVANNEYMIRWLDSDSDDDALIDLYYQRLFDGNTDRRLLVADLSEDDPADAYRWYTATMGEGFYRLCAVIDDGHVQVDTCSDGVVRVVHGGGDGDADVVGGDSDRPRSEPSDGCSCAASAQPGGALFWGGLLAILVGWRRRARRRSL